MKQPRPLKTYLKLYADSITILSALLYVKWVIFTSFENKASDSL